MHRVTHLTIEQGVPRGAIDCGRAAGSYGSPAGGIARARHDWRYNDGTFMSYDNEEQIRLEQREQMAPGDRARARDARRAPDGTFLANNSRFVRTALK